MSAANALELAQLSPPELFRILADDTRLRAMVLMHAEGELCVCELTKAIGVSQPKMSRHLAVLRDAGLVRDRRERIWIHYQIEPNLTPWVYPILAALCQGVAEDSPYCDDRQRLAAMPDRPGDRCPELTSRN